MRPLPGTIYTNSWVNMTGSFAHSPRCSKGKSIFCPVVCTYCTIVSRETLHTIPFHASWLLWPCCNPVSLKRHHWLIIPLCTKQMHSPSCTTILKINPILYRCYCRHPVIVYLWGKCILRHICQKIYELQEDWWQKSILQNGLNIWIIMSDGWTWIPLLCEWKKKSM